MATFDVWPAGGWANSKTKRRDFGLFAADGRGHAFTVVRFSEAEVETRGLDDALAHGAMDVWHYVAVLFIVSMPRNHLQTVIAGAKYAGKTGRGHALSPKVSQAATQDGGDGQETRDTAPVPTANGEALRPVEIGALVERYSAKIWRVLRRMGLGPQDAEDVCQEAFVIAHRRLQTFDGRSRVETWLCGIAMNVARDFFKRERRRRERETEAATAAEAASPVTSQNQEKQLVVQARRAFLDRVLMDLTETQRATFVLYEIGELSVPEIAELHDAPVQTVYARLHRARAHVAAATQKAVAQGEIE